MYVCIYIYIYIYSHVHVMRTSVCVLFMLDVYTCVCIYIHTYIHTYINTYIHIYIYIYTCGLAHARRCCQPPVCLSLSRLHGQPSPGANISVSNVQVCICLCIWHAYTCRTLVVGIVKQSAFKLSPSNSQTKSLRPRVSHA
jgi:hypothetical protein